MPTVPVYDTPMVSASAVPDVRQQTPGNITRSSAIDAEQTQRLGNAIMGAGKMAMDIQTANQIQQNEIVAKNHDSAQVVSNDAVLHGSDDGTTPGYLSLKGDDAVKAYDDTVKKLQQIPVDLSSKLTNTAQQQLVANTQQLRMQSAIEQAKIHRDQQLQVANATASQVRIKAGGDSAVKAFNPILDTPTAKFDQENPANNSAYQQGLQTVISETRSLYAGNKPDVIDEKVKEALADTYVNTLAYMLGGKKGAAADSGSLASAKKYFESVQDQLTPDQIDRIKPVLDASQHQDDVLTATRALEAMPGSYAAKVKALGDAFDNKGTIGGVTVHRDVYEYAKNALDRAESQRQSEADKGTASVVGQAQDFLIRHPGAAVTDLPRPIYVALMNKGQLASVDSFASREANVKTPPAVFSNVLTHFGDGSPLDITKLSDTDWVNMRSTMSESDWRTWSQKRDNQMKGVTTPGKDPGDLSTSDLNHVLNNRLVAIGLDPRNKNTDKNQVGAIQQFVSDAVLSAQHAAGRRLNQAEIAKVVDQTFATSVNMHSTFMGFDRGTTPTRMLNLTVKDLPSGAYDGIKQDLIRSGNPTPTDREILLQYWNLHGNRRK